MPRQWLHCDGCLGYQTWHHPQPDGGLRCEGCGRTRYPARKLRVVSNVTRSYDGGHSVELADGSVVAGPYATKPDAQQAKRDLVAGRQPQYAG